MRIKLKADWTLDLNQSDASVSKTKVIDQKMSFLRYVPGAKPGKKRPVPKDNANTDVDIKKRYEEKRTRVFQASWKQQYNWLEYDLENNVMFCVSCREAGVAETECAFVSGTSCFRKGLVDAHKDSAIHLKSTETKKAKTLPIAQSQGAKCLQKLKKADNDRLLILMRNAHAVAKHNMSLKSYVLLCKLDKAKGLAVGETYLNDKAAATFTESIARTTRAGLIQKIKDCDFCSITCDGATDFTGDDLESLYIRTSSRGKIEDSFLSIGCSESACSQDIFTFIKNVFKRLGIEDAIMPKLVGFCADGASNMQGVKSGLAALLKKEWPHLLSTHCLAHRLELSFKDTVKQSCPKIYEKVTTLLLGLYYLYRKSPKEKKGLLRAFESVQIKPILPTRIGGTRWLPHYERAIRVISKGYKAFRFHLENSSHKNPKAEGLVKLLRDGHVIVFILTLKRVIEPVMKLSLYLQTDGISLADAYGRVDGTKTSLSHMRS
ncbi:ZN862-like protein, partial [Mya arenaria]